VNYAATAGGVSGPGLTRRAKRALLIGVVTPVVLIVTLAISPSAGLLISPLALVASVVALLGAISTRRGVEQVYSRGQRVYQPIEAELDQARTVTVWAISLSVPAIPVELVFLLVLVLF
jgi:ribose/xylose/arabinose/galactoside ABC-type transport system permease subunit